MSETAAIQWRQGHKVPVNVYAGDRPVCQCHAVEDAKLIVAAVNDYLARQAMTGKRQREEGK